jgi:hypothetical protein
VDPVEHAFLYEYLHPKPQSPHKSTSKLKDSVKRNTEYRRKSLEKGEPESSPRALISEYSNLIKLTKTL